PCVPTSPRTTDGPPTKTNYFATPRGRQPCRPERGRAPAAGRASEPERFRYRLPQLFQTTGPDERRARGEVRGDDVARLGDGAGVLRRAGGAHRLGRLHRPQHEGRV